MSDFAAVIRNQVDPLFQTVIDTLDAGGNAYPMAFFTALKIRLNDASDEVEVLNLFIELSTTAFQGFVFSPDEAAAVDQLLEACEQISHMMTAADDRPH